LNVCNGGIAAGRMCWLSTGSQLCAGCLDRGHEFYCLPNLRKVRRRRKPFQRRPQNVLGVGRAACGLLDLGERERGAQVEAAGFLALCNGDGGQQGLLDGSDVGGVLFQQDLAAGAMQQ
jgi:hypothetical protein